MANKMLVDATHPEETRVVVVRGNRVEEFDFESASRKQLRGNIYLAKVTRVEPSLQAAFVEYGGNRHGFLAFSEIHPDYYQIPVADRQALIAEEERAERASEAEFDRRASRPERGRKGRWNRAAHSSSDVKKSDPVSADDEAEAEALAAEVTPDLESSQEDRAAEAQPNEASADAGAGEYRAAEFPFEQDNTASGDAQPFAASEARDTDNGESVGRKEDSQSSDELAEDAEHPQHEQASGQSEDHGPEDEGHEDHGGEDHGNDDHGGEDHGGEEHGGTERGGNVGRRNGNGAENGEEEEVIESVGGEDALEEVSDRMPRLRRQYKIQEVIKRRQVMLVQVVKEERGSKGAALTTYLSLAGRYSVLMPNTARGGGISRKITSALDRKRLKEVASDLDVPDGMGVILRTAGANRTKPEIKRDFEYLLRVWETVRDLTLKSTAPTLVYEEGSLVKRSIRDLYNKDIDEVLLAGDDAYREAKDFMRMLMPSHAKNVKPYKDPQPLFTRYGVESQLDAMFSPVIQLRSGGYIVVNQAEALVAIDVNSGRATREHHIEDTALKTNMEAAEEVARQLRLRDLAGLIVIDFIDMDEKRNNRSVERKLKECLKHDRARIQVGRISHFGLLEMSRQRIRTGVLESSTEKCPHCGGSGHVRSVGSVALQLLRSIEEMLIKGATHNLIVRTRGDIAIYVLNHKRAHLRELETRFRVTITINADPAMGGQPPFIIDRGEQVHSIEVARSLAAQTETAPTIEPVDEDEEAPEAEETPAEPQVATEDGDPRRRRRGRRGRRGEGRERGPAREHVREPAGAMTGSHADDEQAVRAESDGEAENVRADEPGGPERETHADSERRRRRRGRRGGRRNRRERGPEESFAPEGGSSPIEPELANAVADFGGPIAEPQWPQAEHRPQRQYREDNDQGRVEALPLPEPREPAPSVETALPPPMTERESPRRRSTVREPAPFVVGTGTAPIAPPSDRREPERTDAASPEPAEQAGQPRRTGWWARRFLGDKG